MFYCGLDKDTISRIRNKIIPKMLDWHVECNTQKRVHTSFVNRAKFLKIF